MSTILAKVLQFGTPFAVISGSSIFTYHNYGPKTIKHWREALGKGWIGEDSDQLYKSVFHDGKSGDMEEEIGGLEENTEENEAATKIKEWCRKTLDERGSRKLDETFEKFCVYKPVTVKGLLIGAGKDRNLMDENSDEEYKIMFVLFKGTTKYISRVKATSTTPVEEGKEKLKTGCKTELNKKISESPYRGEKFNSIMTLCTKPPTAKTVEERIKVESEDWEMVDENNTEKGKKTFKKGKHTREIIAAIKRDDGDNNYNLSDKTDDDTGGSKMKSGCKNGMSKEITEEGVYPIEYKQLKSACKKT